LVKPKLIACKKDRFVSLKGGKMTTTTKTNWRMAGEEVGGCNCAWGCPCQFNALPTHGQCEAFVCCQIQEGYFGITRLDGVRFAHFFWWPGPIHLGNGTRQLIIDEQTTPAQRDALIALDTGTQGGTIFEIFAAVCSNVPETLVAPITFESDRESREAHVLIPGIGELRAEPIKNPITGEEHRARIVLPNGFEYTEAEVGNSVLLRVQSTPPLVFEHHDTYAQLNAFDWTNA
jgi:hypothetical protein